LKFLEFTMLKKHFKRLRRGSVQVKKN